MQSSIGPVFISYSRRDEAVMQRIAAYLRRRGINVWVDNEKLKPGTPIWEAEIEKAINAAPAVIVILSPDSKNSEWVRREIAMADQSHTRIFPVLVRGDEQSSTTLRLITRQYVDLRFNENEGLKSLRAELSAFLEGLEAQNQPPIKDTETLAVEQARLEAAAKAEQEKEQRKAVERAEAEKAKREAAENAAREKAQRWSARKAEIVKKLNTALWSLKRAVSKPPFPKVAGFTGIVAVLFLAIFMAAGSQELFFTSNRDGKTEIYKMVGSDVDRVTHTPGDAESWSPVLSTGGTLYFTSNRDGKAEIYKLTNGKTTRVTHTDGTAESWSPAVSLGGNLYFTSNREGKAEIYKLSGSRIEKVTHTPGTAESWAPALSAGGTLYFTSNRDGKLEIYELAGGKAKRVTNTDGSAKSWSPVMSFGGTLYFTSDREGKAEIYLLHSGRVEKVTHTAGTAECWSPRLWTGETLYFTSNRDGKAELFKLDGGTAVRVTHTSDKFESWTEDLMQQIQGLTSFFSRSAQTFADF